MKDSRRFAELMDRHLDHRLDEMGRCELEAMLLESAGFRREFWERAEMEGLLQEWGRSQQGVEPGACGSPNPPHPGWWRSRWLAPAAGIAAAVALTTWIWNHQAKPPADSPGNNDVAVLTLESGARWRPGSDVPKAGQFIGSVDLELESGRVLLEFVSGSELMIGGPARVRLSGPNEISCRTGDLTIHQPTRTATFVVHTPAGVVQDIHQTVALRVRPDTTDLLVEENGRGALRLADATSSPLPAGEVLRVVPGGTFTKIAGMRDDFSLQLQQAAELTAAAMAMPGHWLATSKRLNEHPDLVVRYTFDDIPPDAPRLPNQAEHSSSGLDGTVGGGQLKSGRWPYKLALEMDRRFDGVRLNVPGTYQNLTMAAWIQIQGYDNRFSGLFMSDGIKQGGFHWQIWNTGALHLGVTHSQPGYATYTSPPVLTPETFGTWQHVAVVFDLSGRKVSHYCNGRLASRHEMTDVTPVQPRGAMLGNWDPLDDKDEDMIRNFRGRMDDFSIYRTALSSEEIQQLFEQGRIK